MMELIKWILIEDQLEKTNSYIDEIQKKKKNEGKKGCVSQGTQKDAK